MEKGSLEDKLIKNLVKGKGLEVSRNFRIYTVMSVTGEIIPVLDVSKNAKEKMQEYKPLWNTYKK